MNYEQVRTAILTLSDDDQKRLIMEVIPQIWPMACRDDACLQRMRSIVDEDAVKEYRVQHMDAI